MYQAAGVVWATRLVPNEPQIDIRWKGKADREPHNGGSVQVRRSGGCDAGPIAA
jgi:hypothetical protein